NIGSRTGRLLQRLNESFPVLSGPCSQYQREEVAAIASESATAVSFGAGSDDCHGDDRRLSPKPRKEARYAEPVTRRAARTRGADRRLLETRRSCRRPTASEADAQAHPC